MVNLKKWLGNPFIAAAFFTAVLIYSNAVVPADKNPYSGLVSRECLLSVTGTVSSNPVKSSSEKTYSFFVNLEKSEGKVNGYDLKSSAEGKIKVFVPASTAEALFPGKLYSSAKSAPLIEEGEKIICKGIWNSKLEAFNASDVENISVYDSVVKKISHFRALCRLVLKRLLFSWGECGGLLLALLSGSREYTSNEIRECFRNAGLSHILALSGMHLSFFAGIAGFTGKKFFGKSSSFFARLFGIIFFVWFAGFSPSLFRAFLCSMISLLCSALFCEKSDFLSILSCAFLIHCMIFPSDVYTAAFILSYGALCGIVCFADFFAGKFSAFLPPAVASSVAASLSAQIFTAPVSIFMFGAFMPVGIIASVIVSPLISLFFLLGIIFILTGLMFPFLSVIYGIIINILFTVIIFFVKIFALVPPVNFN